MTTPTINPEVLKLLPAKLATRFTASPEEQLHKVCQRGELLRYVHNQTPEICLAAVQIRGYVLKYVHSQTPEICLAAVKQEGEALKYVRNQTPEICLAAVQQNNEALKYVNFSLLTPEQAAVILEVAAD